MASTLSKCPGCGRKVPSEDLKGKYGECQKCRVDAPKIKLSPKQERLYCWIVFPAELLIAIVAIILFIVNDYGWLFGISMGLVVGLLSHPIIAIPTALLIKLWAKATGEKDPAPAERTD